MLKVDVGGISQEEVEALVDVTQKFVDLAETLLYKGDISQEEYNSMTLLKKRFLHETKSKYA